MFGITAFAQSPFASLGGNFYGVVVNEKETLTNLQNVLAVFVGIQSETQTLTTIQGVFSAFLAAQVETQLVTDSNSAVQNFPVIENASIQTLTNLQNVQARFEPLCVDLITLSDYQICKGWFNIDDRQNITWVRIDGTQAPLWDAINDTQTPNWVRIDDTQ